jgi:hypothetical protein
MPAIPRCSSQLAFKKSPPCFALHPLRPARERIQQAAIASEPAPQQDCPGDGSIARALKWTPDLGPGIAEIKV